MFINIFDYVNFVNTKMGLQRPFELITDERKNSRIKTQAIFKALFYAISTGHGGLLQADDFCKNSDLRQIASLPKEGICSDSTITRSISTAIVSKVRKLLLISAHSRLSRYANESANLKGLWMAAIDMSSIAGLRSVVCQIVGPDFTVIVDFEPLKEKDNEVEAAKRLIVRVLNQFGNYIDAMVGDGLYTYWFLKLCRIKGVYGVCKTREKDLELVMKAEELVEIYNRYKILEIIKGIDEDGYKRYEMVEFDMRLPGTDLDVRVIKCWEQQLKSKRLKDEFYLITTSPKEKVSIHEVRKMGRDRWMIENRCFRWTSLALNSKHRFCKKGNAPEVLTTLILTVENCLQAYYEYKYRQRWLDKDKKRTLISVMKNLLRTVPKISYVPKAKKREEKLRKPVKVYRPYKKVAQT
jgi:hypothetical protein